MDGGFQKLYCISHLGLQHETFFKNLSVTFKTWKMRNQTTTLHMVQCPNLLSVRPAIVLAQPPAERGVAAQAVVDVALRLLIAQLLFKLQRIRLLPQHVFVPAQK